MKNTFRFITLALLALSSLMAQASDYEDVARVVSVSERTSGSSQPRRECDSYSGGSQERGLAGAGIGGVAGGLLGAQVGKGNGKVAAAAVGAVAGALVGDRIQNNGAQGGTRCTTVDNYTTRVVGYNVTYEYNGNTYSDYVSTAGYSNAGYAPNPGDTIRVRVHLTPVR